MSAALKVNCLPNKELAIAIIRSNGGVKLGTKISIAENVSEKCYVTANDDRVLSVRGHAETVNQTGELCAPIVDLQKCVVLITRRIGLVAEGEQQARGDRPANNIVAH